MFYNVAANISCSLGRILVRSHTGTAAGQLIRKMSTQQQRNRTRLPMPVASSWVIQSFVELRSPITL